MSNKISNDENIKKVMSQTNYTYEVAKQQLLLFNNDYIKVIKDYMGISDKKDNSNQKITSVNQEIFRQIRHKLDSSMKDYRETHPVDVNVVIANIQESEHRKNTK
jgi:hypothetical protein